TTGMVNGQHEIFVVYTINNCKIKLKINTGAMCNLLSYNDYKCIGLTDKLIQKCYKKIIQLDKSNVPVVGCAMIPLVNKNNETKLLEFIVVNVECPPILDLQASIDLNLITYHINMVSDSEPLINKYTDAIKHEFKDLFDGKLSSIPGTVSITLDSNAKPVAQPARHIPFGLIDDKAELARMVTDGVIESITKPTKWVHNIVIVRRKNNKIRLCLDPRDLNKYIIRARFQLPTFDEVKSRLKDAKFFVVLDASNGFWMLNLDEASSELLTFITPFGRFAFKRMAFGVALDSSSQGLGAVILQNNKPIVYSSRALTKSEQAYCLIEREMLGIVNGCIKPRQFLIGRRIEVHTDHRPLETLFKRPLNKVPPRLQRMMLAVQGFDLHVVYKPGKELFIAEALSRAFVDEPVEKEFSTLNEQVICQVNALIECLPIADRILDKIKNETCKDTELIELKKYITAGWPDNKNKLNQIINPYWTYKEELHIIDEILTRDDPWLGLMEYRNTPKEHMPSPAQLLYSRNLRTKILVRSEDLKPKVYRLPEKFVRHQDTVKKYYDKRTRSLQSLREGQNIRFQSSPTPATPPTNSTLEFPQPVQINQQIGDSTLQETAEGKAVKNLDNKITRSGRVVRNPEKLFDD
ncbi:hypothetical protein ILUMI_16186, partial [Ignelater luminosus]